ncbi:MAG: flavodoxin domain-containing protein [Cellulomonas sp.]
MHVLVTTGSRHGSTREIGEAIAEVLERGGHTVEQVDPDEVTSLVGFDAVVLGSAVYVGQFSESVRALARRLEGALTELPLWLFWSGPLGASARPIGEPDDVDFLVRRLSPRGVRMFGGRLAPPELGMIERAQIAAVDVVAGDYRDFDEIDAWAGMISLALAPKAPQGTEVPPSSAWNGLARP